MLDFPSYTSPADELAIERSQGAMAIKGYSGDIIVYRNKVDVALTNLALAAFPQMSFLVIREPNGHFIIVGTKTAEDGRQIRGKVDSLREMISPAFEHLQPQSENTKRHAPKRGFNP